MIKLLNLKENLICTIGSKVTAILGTTKIVFFILDFFESLITAIYKSQKSN